LGQGIKIKKKPRGIKCGGGKKGRSVEWKPGLPGAGRGKEKERKRGGRVTGDLVNLTTSHPASWGAKKKLQ